jgi:hypothetical protein
MIAECEHAQNQLALPRATSRRDRHKAWLPRTSHSIKITVTFVRLQTSQLRFMLAAAHIFLARDVVTVINDKRIASYFTRPHTRKVRLATRTSAAKR